MVEWGTSMRDQVAKAIYDQQVKTARERIEAIQFDPTEIEDITRMLVRESETAQVLIFYSYLDDRFQQLLKWHLVHLNTKSDEDKLFGLNGPMNTFHSRILLAYHLGWLSSTNKAKLDAFRKIRNEFAHRAFKVSITDPVVQSHLAALDFDLPVMMKEVTTPSLNEKFSCLLCQLIMLALNTFKELIVLPVAKAQHVAPQDVASSYDESPAILRRITLSMSGALLIAARIPEKVGSEV